MITVEQLLNIVSNKPYKTPIKFKWENDNNFEWECDGLSFPDKESVIDKYNGIGFFLLSDDHKEDWWATCGTVKECLLDFLKYGITYKNSIIGYDTTVDERQITIIEQNNYLLAIVHSEAIEWYK